MGLQVFLNSLLLSWIGVGVFVFCVLFLILMVYRLIHVLRGGIVVKEFNFLNIGLALSYIITFLIFLI